MGSLYGKALDLFYGDFLQVSNTGIGIDTTLRTVSSALGTSSALQISSSTVNINGTFKINGTTLTNIAITGAFTLGFTVTGNTSIILPTSGTMATLAGSEVFTNKTLTTPIIATISNTGTLTLPTSTDTLVGRATTDTLTNKTLTSPIMTTPTLGVASATSYNKVIITAPASSSTLTIADGKTLTASNTLTFTGTDSSSVAFGTGGTVSYLTAATQSDQVAGTSLVKAVTPGRQQYHPSAAKASCSFLGSDATIGATYNITSIVKSGTGIYTITLTTPFSNTAWIPICSGLIDNTVLVVVPQLTAFTVNTVTLHAYNAAGTLIDPFLIYFVAYGTQ